MAGSHRAAVSPACPCGSGTPYVACCQPLHDGMRAATAEALMRSRYCAYVLGLEAYLLATWHPGTRPQKLELASDHPPKWLGLEVRRHIAAAPESATVEFVARYRLAGRAERLHETSRFSRVDGVWYYLDGEMHQR